MINKFIVFIANLIEAVVGPEKARAVFLIALKYLGITVFFARKRFHPSLQQDFFGIRFDNPLGAAPGIDKNGDYVNSLSSLGFGFIEIGSVTLEPHKGNSGKKLFILKEDKALINRYGLPSCGAERLIKKFEGNKEKNTSRVIGINISYVGENENAEKDYFLLAKKLAKYANYFTINVSCPNVKNGKDLQSTEFLPSILQSVKRGMEYEAVPILLKLSSDTSHNELSHICDCAKEHGVDGLIVGNTTVSRPDGLRSRYKEETGGLSGVPLFDLSTRKLAEAYLLCGRTLPLVGVGGIASAEDAYTKIKAGASLLQLYSGLRYGGLGLVGEIVDGLPKLLAADGYNHLQEAVGCEAERWANSP